MAILYNLVRFETQTLGNGGPKMELDKNRRTRLGLPEAPPAPRYSCPIESESSAEVSVARFLGFLEVKSEVKTRKTES